MKLEVSWQKGFPFKVRDFIVLLNFERYSQNNIAILVLWKIVKKLYSATVISLSNKS